MPGWGKPTARSAPSPHLNPLHFEAFFRKLKIFHMQTTSVHGPKSGTKPFVAFFTNFGTEGLNEKPLASMS